MTPTPEPGGLASAPVVSVATATRESPPGAVVPPPTHSVPVGGRRASSVLLWALVVAGAVLRIRQYAFDRSLWNDEAALALNVMHRSFWGLTKPLGIVQGAPVGFLWAQKATISVLGSSELALRLVPLVVSLLGLFLYPSLVRRFLPPWPACLAVGLFALSPALVYYASEAKQYAVDVTAAIVLAWLYCWMVERAITWRRAGTWGAVCAVVVWCSFSAPFVAGAGALSAVLVALRRGRPAEAGRVVAATSLWLASFAGVYVLTLRTLHSTKALVAYWRDGFAPKPLRLGTTLTWLGSATRTAVHDPFRLDAPPLALALMALGLVALLVRSPGPGVFAVVLVAAVAVAGILGQYPFQDRLILFLAPFVFILVAASTTLWRPWGWGALCVVVAVAVSAAAVGNAVSVLYRPYTRTEARAAVQYVLDHQRPGDGVAVEWEGAALVHYYQERLGISRDAYFRLAGTAQPCDDAATRRELARWSRVWLVFAITDPGREAQHDPIGQYERAFAPFGHIVSTFRAPGDAGAALLDVHRSTTPAVTPAPSWQPGPHGCLTVAPFPAGGR